MIKRTFSLLTACFCLMTTPLCSIEDVSQALAGFSDGITVDLREPVFCQGVLTTEKGGVISGSNIRIQAQNIIYTKKDENGIKIFKIEAENDLMLEIGEHVFIGRRLEYDFNERRGVIYDGHSGIEPWYFGGDIIELEADGSYHIHNAFFTTSENFKSEWAIIAEEAHISSTHFLKSSNVRFQCLKVPLFWIPRFSLNLDALNDSPIKYRAGWGGSQGTRFGLTYEILAWQRFKALLRADYRVKRGLGGGFETHYNSLDSKAYFDTVNYIARDSSVSNPDERTRYRFEGLYHNQLFDDSITVDMTYDKFSDIDMPGDYDDFNLDLETGKRTQLIVRRQEDYWISNFSTRVRVNNFQTVKQELPTIETSVHPFVLGDSGIIMENLARASYLDFKYAKNLPHDHNYNSSRIMYLPRLYRPFALGPITAMPEIGAVGIFYGNSPQGDSKVLAMAKLGCEFNTQIYRYVGRYKHVIEPYTNYNYYTYPETPPDEHYIFDIDDGWYRVNMLTFGVRNMFIKKGLDDRISRVLAMDIYTNAFFDTPTIGQSIPRVYSKFVFNTFSTLKHTLNLAWDIEHRQMLHYIFRTDWTVNDDLAISAEYRHRNRWDWRKVDYENYVLDSFHSENRMLHTQLSDRRDTLLLHLFYRFRPTWALELKAHQGWNRRFEPSYNEYEIDLHTTIRSAWHVRFSLQHQQNDNNKRPPFRVAMYISVGLSRPDAEDAIRPPPSFE